MITGSNIFFGLTGAQQRGVDMLVGCRKFIQILCFLCFFVAPWVAAEDAGGGEVGKYVFMDEPLPPYVYGDDSGVCERGVTKDIFDELFRRLGMSYEIRLVPWARAIHIVSNGGCDGVPLLMKNKERELYLKFTDPVVENRELVYFLPDRMGAFRWERLSDLKGYTIGLIREYTYGDALLGAINSYGIKVSYARDSELNFNMLQAGHVDMVVEDETVAKAIFAEHPEWASRISSASKPVSSYYWHIGIGQHSRLAGHIDAINRVLGAMRADGSLAKILNTR